MEGLRAAFRNSHMLKPSLQLKLGQQLTMTPQLQQAIRLLQLPALELQAHIRELLESNVMLEPMEELEATGTFETVVTAAEQPKSPEPTSTVEVLDDGWDVAWRRSRRDRLERATRTSASRSMPMTAASRCRSTCCGSWSWRASRRASWPSPAPWWIPSAMTATSPNRSRRSPDAAPGAGVLDAGGQRGAAHRAGARSPGHRRTLGQRVPGAAAAAAGSGHPRLRHRHRDRASSPGTRRRA